MVIGYAAFLFVMGVLGASSLIIAKKPDAKELIAKIAPYEGWIGVLGVLGGVYELIFFCLPAMGWLGDGLMWMLYWIISLVVAVTKIGLGLILGVGTAKTFIKNDQAIEKLTTLSAKLAPFKGTLGLLAIGLAIAEVVFHFLL